MIENIKKAIKDNKEIIWIIISGALLGAVVFAKAFNLESLRFTPITIGLITACSLFFWQAKDKNKVIVAGATILISFGILVLGVNTGFIFGDLEYQGKLGYQLFNVPLILGALWFLISLSAWQIARLSSYNIHYRAIITGGLVVMFELVFQQFGNLYAAWFWSEGEASLLNYFLWFFVGVVFSYIYDKVSPAKSFSIYVATILPILALFFWLMMLAR